jgi:lysophospholipase L1-like esterase
MLVRGHLLAVAAGLLATVAPLAASPDRAYAGVSVSLGDSYSSGEGERPYDDGTARRFFNGCHRSPNAWPRLLGVMAGHHLACSGAKTEHIVSKGKARSGPDRFSQLEQLRALAGTTDIDTVFLTIGGNDADFSGKIRSCRFHPRGCLRDLDKLDREIAGLGTPLKRTYAAIAGVVPADARVVVVGYPDLVPGSKRAFTGCGWITTEEKARIQHLQRVLDRSLQRAASDAGVEYVSIRDALRGRELCTRDSWVVPITSSQRHWLSVEQGHPTKRGQQAIADRVRTYLDRSATPSCQPSSNTSVIVDDSSSMIDNDPAQIRRRALELLITKPSGQGRTLGAVEFGTTAQSLFAPALVGDGQGAMLAALDALDDDGAGDGSTTDYNEAFAVSATSHPNATSRVFLTDGEHNEGEFNDGHVGGPPTYVIGLNIGPSDQGEEGADLLGRIAGETGGRYFPLRLSDGDDTQAQVSRLQPVMNEIDTLLGCQSMQRQADQQFTSPGQIGPPVGGRFVRRQALELVVTWADPGADIDLHSATVRDRRSRAIANLGGTGRIRGTHRRRGRLSVNTVEGETFETVTVQRPPNGRTLRIRLTAPELTQATDVNVQVRVVPPGAAPGTTEVGAQPPAPTPPPAPGPSPTPDPPAQPPSPPRRVITVYNKVTNGMRMDEDDVPARLTTQTWTFCGLRGCNINGTERWTGGTYDAAVCQTHGERTTNGNDHSSADDANPERYESTRYYGVRLADGTFGYVSEVWIRAADRGGLGLPAC